MVSRFIRTMLVAAAAAMALIAANQAHAVHARSGSAPPAVNAQM